jgi:putative oxidoreductase
MAGNSGGHHLDDREEMKPKSLSWIAITGLRVALGTAFLSAVAGRLGLWGKYGSSWENFLRYTESVNWYLPVAVVPAVAILATVLETCFGVALLVGWQTRKAALGSSVLLTLFAVAMFSGNPKSPFDYSVFTAAFGALTLATHSALHKPQNSSSPP